MSIIQDRTIRNITYSCDNPDCSSTILCHIGDGETSVMTQFEIFNWQFHTITGKTYCEDHNLVIQDQMIALTPITFPDWSEVIRQAKAHLSDREKGNYQDDNDDIHYMYEAVMEAVYGEGIWDYMRSLEG